jgi:hypothetical protein
VHCRFPGCDMPHQFVQIHHVKHWVHGGHTDRSNLIMLCGFHHRLIHNTPGWVISGNPNQRLVFANPNNKKYFSDPPGLHLLTG